MKKNNVKGAMLKALHPMPMPVEGIVFMKKNKPVKGAMLKALHP